MCQCHSFVKLTYRQASEWWFADIFAKIVFLELNELQHQGCKSLVGWWIGLKVLNMKQNKTVKTHKSIPDTTNHGYIRT